VATSNRRNVRRSRSLLLLFLLFSAPFVSLRWIFFLLLAVSCRLSAVFLRHFFLFLGPASSSFPIAATSACPCDLNSTILCATTFSSSFSPRG